MDDHKRGTDAHYVAIAAHDRKLRATEFSRKQCMSRGRVVGRLTFTADHIRLFCRSCIYDGDMNSKTVDAIFGDLLTSVVVSDKRVGMSDNLSSVAAVTKDVTNLVVAERLIARVFLLLV